MHYNCKTRMRRLLLVGLTVTFSLSAVAAQTAPPVIPETFTAVLTFQTADPQPMNVSVWFDLPHGRSRIDAKWTDSTGTPREIWQYQRWDLHPPGSPDEAVGYGYCVYAKICQNISIIGDKMPAYLDLSQTQFVAMEFVNGILTEHWSYSFRRGINWWDEDYFVAKGKLPSTGKPYYWPVKYVYAGYDGGFVKEWSKFTPTESIPESVFNVEPSWDCHTPKPNEPDCAM